MHANNAKKALDVYQQTVNGFIQTAEFSAMLDFLKSIYCAHENQEFDVQTGLSGNLTPAQGFELSLSVHHDWPVKEQLKRIFKYWQGPQSDNADLEVKPFNAMRYMVDSANKFEINSGFLPVDGEFRDLYDLYIYFDIDDEEDDSDEDPIKERHGDFQYDMQHKDKYTFRFQDTTISSADLYNDLLIALIGKNAHAVANALVTDKRFARMPKSLPFCFCIGTGRPGRENPVISIPFYILDEGNVKTLATDALHKKNQINVREFSESERIEYLLGYLEREWDLDESPELQELFAKARQDRHVFELLLDRLWEMPIKESGNLIHHTESLWTLGRKYQQDIMIFYRELFRYKDDAFGKYHKNEDPNFDSPTYEIERFLYGRWQLWQGLPKKHRATLHKIYTSVIKPFTRHDVAMVRIVAWELLADIKFKVPRREDIDKGPDFNQLSNKYVNTVIGLLKAIDDHIGNAQWDNIFSRLECIGPRAAAAIPVLEEILAGILAREIDCVTPRDRRQILHDFGHILYRLGSTSIPSAIQKAIDKEAEGLWYAYYKKWKKIIKPLDIPKDEAETKTDSRKKKTSALAHLTPAKLASKAKTDPYEVFVECERRLLAGQCAGLDKAIKPACDRIEAMLLAATGRDRIIDAFMTFAHYFMENIYIDDEPEEGIFAAIEILERRQEQLLAQC